MLTVSQLTGFNTTYQDVILTYITQITDTSNATIYTHTAAAIGTADLGRQVVVSVYGNAAAAPNSAVSTLTIGGISATQQVTQEQSGLIVEIWTAIVPTGTTANIVITYGEAQTASSIGIHTLLNAAITPFDTDANALVGGGGDTLITLTALNVPFGGAAVCNFANVTAAGTTWTNATERFDATPDGSHSHSGADLTTFGTTTITADGATDGQAIVGVSWGPS